MLEHLAQRGHTAPIVQGGVIGRHQQFDPYRAAVARSLRYLLD
jgi:hypothetical protein